MKTSTHRIGIDSEQVLIERRVNTNNIPHLVVNLEFQGRHRGIEVYTVQVMHDKNLRITLATIAWL